MLCVPLAPSKVSFHLHFSPLCLLPPTPTPFLSCYYHTVACVYVCVYVCIHIYMYKKIWIYIYIYIYNLHLLSCSPSNTPPLSQLSVCSLYPCLCFYFVCVNLTICKSMNGPGDYYAACFFLCQSALSRIPCNLLYCSVAEKSLYFFADWCVLSHLDSMIYVHVCLPSLTSSRGYLGALFSYLDSGNHHFLWKQNIRLRGNAITDWGPKTLKPSSTPVPTQWGTIHQREVEETSFHA